MRLLITADGGGGNGVRVRLFLRAILAGGLEKLREAETVLLGGHSIVDEEMKYGLAITGFVHPGKILANQGLKAGECLILTKALGWFVQGPSLGLVALDEQKSLAEQFQKEDLMLLLEKNLLQHAAASH